MGATAGAAGTSGTSATSAAVSAATSSDMHRGAAAMLREVEGATKALAALTVVARRVRESFMVENNIGLDSVSNSIEIKLCACAVYIKIWNPSESFFDVYLLLALL